MRGLRHSRRVARALLGLLLVTAGTALPPRHAAAPAEQPERASAAPDSTPAARTHRLAGHVVDDTGAPLAAAELRLQPTPAEPANAASKAPAFGEAEPPRAEVDAEGRFLFKDVPAGHYTLHARAPFHEPTARPVVTVPAEAPVQLTLQRTGVLRGIVEGPDGPVAGASIHVAGSGLWPPRRVESDTSGHFEVTGIPEGLYELHAATASLVSEPMEPLQVRPGEPTDARLQLKPGVKLSGRVVDADDGAPVADARLLLSHAGLTAMPLPDRTDEQGRFTSRALRRGAHRITVRAEGYVPIDGRTVRPSTRPLELKLTRAAVIEGRVVDERREPVPNAQIRISGTTAQGEPLVMSALSATLRSSLFDAQQQMGHALHASGHLGVTRGPVPSVSDLPALPELGGRELLYVDPASGYVTDAEGRFRLDGIPPGDMQVIAMHGDHAPGGSELLHLEAGERVGSLELTLPHGGVVAGRVVDADGYPMPRVRVQLVSDHDPFPRVAVTDGHGRFELDRVHGPSTVSAHPVGLPPAQQKLEVASNARHHLELRVAESAHRLAGRVVDADADPVGDAVVRVHARGDGSSVMRTAHSASDGSFEVTALPEPPYRVHVDHHDHAPVELPRVAAQQLEITLRRGVHLQGRLLDDWTQQPLSDLRVTLQGDGGHWQDSSDNRGYFGFHRVPPGRYELAVDSPVHLAERRTLEVQPLEPGEKRRELEPFWLKPGGSVSGRVVDRFGSAVPGAHVAAGEPPAWEHAATTDADGRFELRGLSPGRTRVRARHPEQKELTTEPASTRVFAKQRSPGLVLRLDLIAEEAIEAKEPVPAAEEEPSGGADAGSAEKHDGLRLVFREGRVVAARVPRGSTAFRAGLREGDRIVAVDGERVLSAGQAQGMLRGPAHGAARVVLERNGSRKRVRVPRSGYGIP